MVDDWEEAAVSRVAIADADEARTQLRLMRNILGVSGPDGITRDVMHRLLLDAYPRAIVTTSVDIPKIMRVAGELGSGAALPPEDRVRAAFEDESLYGPGKRIAIGMGATEEDLRRPEALLDAFNDLPVERREAILGIPSQGGEDFSGDRGLAAAVQDVHLVRDVLRLAEWVGDGKPVGPDRMPIDNALGLPYPGLAWIVAVNSKILEIAPGRAVAGPLIGILGRDDEEILRFWDGVVMDVLDRCDFGLTGRPEIDAELPATLTRMHTDDHRPDLPDDVLALLAYCGLLDGASLTPLGRYGMAKELQRTAP